MKKSCRTAVAVAFISCVSATAQTAVLAEVSGIVSVKRADGSLSAGNVGMSLQAGDFVTAEAGSRAVVTSAGSVLRLNWDTTLELLPLRKVRVRKGSVAAEIAETSGTGWVFESPAGPLHIDAPGTYRIDADRVRNSVRLSVQTGQVHMGGQWVGPGQCSEMAESGIADLRETVGREGFNSAAWVWPTPGRILNVVATHDSNANRANEMVRQANHPGEAPERFLAPTHQMISPPIVGPHATVPIGLPHSGVTVVK